jgi:hypothetical protein
MGFNSAFKGLSYQDSQQHRACMLTKISQHGNSATPTNIKVVGWFTKYKKQINFLVISCLKLQLSHVHNPAFFMSQQP